MPKKSHPPAPAGTTPSIPSPAPRAFDPALAKGPKAPPPRGAGYSPHGKSANRLIHAQKARGR